MHLWHHIEPHPVKFESIHAINEIPKGSRNKYELDGESGIIKLDRTLATSVKYPVNYGFIQRTLSGDGDALDIMIFAQEPIYPSILMNVRPIGIIKVIDGGETDHKILSVMIEDPEYGEIESSRNLPRARIKELLAFLGHYKSLEKKEIRLGPILGMREAWKIIDRALEKYRSSEVFVEI